jgi:hypothetical protein
VPTRGIDIAGMMAGRPATTNLFANGGWLKATAIPRQGRHGRSRSSPIRYADIDLIQGLAHRRLPARRERLAITAMHGRGGHRQGPDPLTPQLERHRRHRDEAGWRRRFAIHCAPTSIP